MGMYTRQMSEDPPSRPVPRSWFERITQALSGEPQSREELIEELRHAQANGLLTNDTLSMVEGAIEVVDLSVADVMVPRAQMVSVPVTAPLPQVLSIVIESGHSRFPVHGEDKDEIVGILLAKDLLRYYHDENFDVRSMLRPAVFVPESKPLNVLLKDFRANRNHMAIVVDEYGGVAGLITIEDILEQIVGDIEDEYDLDEEADNIVAERDGRYRVKALTEIAAFNETFGTQFPDEDFDTIGGFVTDQFGRVPRRGDTLELDGVRFEVLRADARQAHLFQVARVPKTVAREFAEAEAARQHA